VVKGTISDLAAPEKEIYILHALENLSKVKNILQLIGCITSEAGTADPQVHVAQYLVFRVP